MLRWSALAGWARQHDGQSLRLALDAAARIAQQTPIELATLASAVGSDPHCLDHGRTAGTLLLSLLAHRDGMEHLGGAVDRRALLLRCGVMPDLLSSDVLCVGLSGAGDGPAARMLAAMPGRHVRLTYAHLREQRLRFPPGLVVHTCENPVLVARGEQLASPPPLVCTGGQRTTAVALLLNMLTDSGAEIRHHGDFDAGGLAIAALLAPEHGGSPTCRREDAHVLRASARAAACRRSCRPQHTERALDAQRRQRIHRLGTGAKLAAGDRSARECLVHRAGELVLFGMRRRDVDQRAHKRGQAEARTRLDVLVREFGPVDEQRVVLHPEAAGNREVHSRRLELADVVDAERCVVRHDAALLRP